MPLPITIPNTFANATATIPLSQLDSNFSTVEVAVNSIGNGAFTLANAQITGGTISNVTLDNVSVDVETLSNVTITNLTVDGNATFTNAAVTANVATITTANTTDVTASNSAVISVNTSGNALRITQVGSGNAFVVEDSASPDSTPFVIDSSGNIVSGSATQVSFTYASQPRFEVVGTNQSTSTIATASFNAVAGAPSAVLLGRGRGGVASPTVVNSGDDIGLIQFEAHDGAALIPAASILAEVDGTPGTNDMPGRLVFSTTADGASTPTERMRIDSSGNVGIGTSSPAVPLEVSRSGDSQIRIRSTTAGIDARLLTTGDAGVTGTWSNHGFVFRTNDTERARIESGGSFLVGTTTADPIGSKVPGMAFVPGSSQVNAMANGSRSGAFGRYTSTGDIIQLFYHNGTNLLQVGGISTNGTNAAFNTSSDYRLKENVQPMTSALAKVAALKPCTYTWKSDGSAGEGFIAHELAEVVPGCVSGEKDAVNEDGSIKPQGIDTSFLVATLTAAIQELKAELDATKAEVAALKGA